MSVFRDIHPVLKQTVVASTVIASVTDIRRFKQPRAYFRFIPVTILGTLSTLKGTHPFRTSRSRALRDIVEYAFISEPTSASCGLLAIIAKMSLDLSAYGCAIFSDSLCDLREVLSYGKTSLDLDSVIISKMFHG